MSSFGSAVATVAFAVVPSANVTVMTTSYASFVGAFVLSGIGMALFFAPVANVVLSAVRPQEEGKASGTNNAIREMGGVLGVAAWALAPGAAPESRAASTAITASRITTAASPAASRRRDPRTPGVGGPALSTPAGPRSMTSR